ncbi:MAG: MmpS family transport accessory protein [Mycobacterium sp.]
MSDRRRPDGTDPNAPQWSQPTQQLGPTDPAYSGQYSYPAYVPSAGPNPTEALPPYWTQTNQYPQPGAQPGEPPPGPPKSPRWLWIVAALAVLLVIGLVVALVIANGSSKQDTMVEPLPPMPEPSSTAAPSTTRTPTTTTTPSSTVAVPPVPTPRTSESGATETVNYTVSGQGRAISITYVDAGGVLQTEFNVVLPWSREVSLSSPASAAASVTVLNVGREVTCSISVDGAQVRQRSGAGLTICASAG